MNFNFFLLLTWILFMTHMSHLPSVERGTGGEDLLRQEFPIPSPEGGDVVTDEWDGATGYISIRYAAKRYDEIVDYYDDYTDTDTDTDNGDWRRREMGQGKLPTVNYLNLMEGLNISVDPPIGDTLLITLTVS